MCTRTRVALPFTIILDKGAAGTMAQLRAGPGGQAPVPSVIIIFPHTLRLVTITITK